MTMQHRAPVRALLAVTAAATLAGAALLVGAVPAAAHNSLTGSNPADASTVTEPLTEVVLEFDQAVQTEFAQVAVLGADQTPYESGAPVVAGNTVTQAVQALPDGAYGISYRVISADGHPITGALSFTATGQAPVAVAEPPPAPPVAETEAPAATPTDEATAEPAATEAEASPQSAVSEDEDGGLPGAALVGIGIALAAGVAGAAYAVLRRRPGGDTATHQADTGS